MQNALFFKILHSNCVSPNPLPGLFSKGEDPFGGRGGGAEGQAKALPSQFKFSVSPSPDEISDRVGEGVEGGNSKATNLTFLEPPPSGLERGLWQQMPASRISKDVKSYG